VSGSYCSSPLNNVTEAAAAFPENFPPLLRVIKLGYIKQATAVLKESNLIRTESVKLQQSVDLYMSPTTKIQNLYAANITSFNIKTKLISNFLKRYKSLLQCNHPKGEDMIMIAKTPVSQTGSRF